MTVIFSEDDIHGDSLQRFHISSIFQLAKILGKPVIFIYIDTMSHSTLLSKLDELSDGTTYHVLAGTKADLSNIPRDLNAVLSTYYQCSYSSPDVREDEMLISSLGNITILKSNLGLGENKNKRYIVELGEKLGQQNTEFVLWCSRLNKDLESNPLTSLMYKDIPITIPVATSSEQDETYKREYYYLYIEHQGVVYDNNISVDGAVSLSEFQNNLSTQNNKKRIVAKTQNYDAYRVSDIQDAISDLVNS